METTTSTTSISSKELNAKAKQAALKDMSKATKPTHAIAFGDNNIKVVELNPDVKAKEIEKVELKPMVTKKSVIIELISTKKGATVDQIAKEIMDRDIDDDLEKNKRVVRLWLSKIGFKVERLADGYFRKM